jgi:hypothetical protein
MIYQRGMLVFVVLVAAERPRCATHSALQRAALALVVPTHKHHFARGRLQQLLTSSTCRRDKLENDRVAWFQSCLWAAELRSAPARDCK